MVPRTPLWGNPRLSHFQTVPDPVLWARNGITTLADIMSPAGLLSFDALKQQKGLTACSSDTCSFGMLTAPSFPRHRGVVDVKNSVGKLNVTCDLLLMLLGIVDTLAAPQVRKRFVFYLSILLHWKGSAPLSIQFWKTLINKALLAIQTEISGLQLPQIKLPKYGTLGFAGRSWPWTRRWSTGSPPYT